MNESNMKSFFNHCLSLLYPEEVACAACDREIMDAFRYGLCRRCHEEIEWIRGRSCIGCGGPLAEHSEANRCPDCHVRPGYITETVACFGYSGPGKKLIMDLKYNRKTYLAEYFAQMLSDLLGATLIDEFDIIAAVPLHNKRLRKRGFNQMALIGRSLEAVTGKAYASGALMRIRNTAPLKNMDKEQRREALQGVFHVDGSLVRGRRVLLIDDIYTTGATLNACAEALLDEGALAVYASVLAVNFRD